MAFALDNFGCKVLGRAAQRPRSVCHLFGKPKIRDANMALGIQQDILGLQITVNNIFAMQIPRNAWSVRHVIIEIELDNQDIRKGSYSMASTTSAA